ncbi:hypothetical protein SAMN05216490_3526 [Mucilaginibacter mallensis]|uniref:VWA domain-containing protein n=1 Tax=Mucilaginibacter mallensis TaxID=652787 RepID=A0A1H2AGB0_MUCMA|nr:hypothetical protein [Mucilaginibacter mallensis]SDT45003.1 hypothetical protein SAMN05216490_3526 [Mucilaginibacter mallensis]
MLFLFSITWGAVSGWWALACLLLGVLYAWLMYRQPINLANKFRYVLSVVRALTVAIIALLLLAPMLKSVGYKSEKPLVLILQDNSESIKLFNPKGSQSYNVYNLAIDLDKVKSTLGDNYEVHEFNFDKTLHNGLSTKFNGKQTDISAALKQVNEQYVNQNIGAIVLATDGLYNQGSDPQYEARNFKTAIYTVALGDTTPKHDLLIANVNYNKTAFLGNDFEIEVLAEAYQSKGETMRLSVTEDGKQVAAQNIPVNSAAFQKLVPLKLNADRKGVRKFNISIAPVSNELSTQNNSETIYVDVLDAKQKVLLVYNGPHPDVSVIKKGIESNRNFEVKTTLLSDLSTLKIGDYSLVILYQLTPGNSGLLQSLAKTKMPVWYMLGGQSDLQDFNNQQQAIKISSGRAEMQEVFAQPVPEFSAFTLTDSTRQKISTFPPLMAPFGSYTSSPTNQILLKQKIGNVLTTYPLLSFSDEAGRRTGILTGEGLWRWQLAEYKANSNHHAVEELLSQSVQYLTANANRQQFRVYPAKNVFDEGENVILNAELYNDAFELINTPDVKIDLKSVDGKNYSFLFTRSGQSYQLDAGALPVGEYTYSATTKVGPRSFTANGQLTVKALNLETRQSAANHQLLNNIAKQSGGQMLLPSQINRLADLIRKNDNIKTVVYQDKHYSDMIDVKWIFIVILALLSTEWFIRKREGEI